MSAEDKLEAIYKGIQDIKIELAKFIVREEQARKEIDTLNKKVECLESTNNKAFGILTVMGLGGTAFFAWLFKHL